MSSSTAQHILSFNLNEENRHYKETWCHSTAISITHFITIMLPNFIQLGNQSCDWHYKRPKLFPEKRAIRFIPDAKRRSRETVWEKHESRCEPQNYCTHLNMILTWKQPVKNSWISYVWISNTQGIEQFRMVSHFSYFGWCINLLREKGLLHVKCTMYQVSSGVRRVAS